MARDDGHQRDAPTRAENWLQYRDTIQHDPRGTIVPQRAVAGDLSSRIDRLLRRLRAQRASPNEPRFAVGDTIGVGGVGIVRTANQLNLGRQVALKSVREDRRSDENVASLLSEAWVAGALAHPNVVSIHDITLAEDGAPQIVLERIKGEAWTDLMFDAQRVRERFGADDLLEWNLGVLMQVMNAIRFAHTRGIVHRDIKPDNVMIGEFGEVYIVDWGLAVSLYDDGCGILPLANKIEAMAGTPCYMAPEMLGGDDITATTDIYLLGAVLYEILTGQPPHTGPNTRAIIESVICSEPDFPTSVPAGLARICRRAMDPDPTGRFENAEQMRLAIQGFLRNRGSARLAVQAIQALEELQATLSGDVTSRSGRNRRQVLYRLYGACLFGFREALAAWPGNRTARDGLQQATTAMVDYELAQGDARAADALCAAIERPSDELRRRIEEVRSRTEAKERRIANLQEMARDLDMNVGLGFRFVAILILGTFFTLAPLFCKWLFAVDIMASHFGLMAWTGGCMTLGLIIGLVARGPIRESAINRRLYAMLMVVLVAQLIMEVGLWRADIDPQRTGVMHDFVWFLALAGVTVTIDWRLAPSAICYLCVFLVLAEYPSWAMEGFTLPHIVLTINALAIWRPGSEYARPGPPRASSPG